MQKNLKQKSRMITQTATASTLLALLAMNPDAVAQFKKFKSKTRHKSGQVKKAKSNKNAFTNKQTQSEQDAKTFGTRVTGEPSPRNSKYVNLNPETAFGPEIITSFDFPDTEIMDMTRHMQKLTGINLILDKDVKGKVSITAPTPITVGDAWKAYLAALNMAGYTLVKSGAFYKIINARDVRYVPTEIYTGSYTPNTESHMMKVLALKNVDAAEISRNFRPFMSRYGRIIDIKQTNTIIISDTGSNIARLEKLIKFLDVPGYEESLQIIPVKNTSAQEIAKLLDQILKGGSSSGRSTSRRSSTSSSSSRFSGSSSKKSGSNISKIIAEPRTNAIIAMANAEGARQLRELIKKLDTQIVSTNSDKIHVHYLNFGNAEELSKTLSTLVSGSSASRSSTTRPGARGFSQASSGSTLFNGEVKVTADKNNNALVVTASPTDWITLKSVISKLDIPRDQVYVEGMILETTLTKVRAFGTEFVGAYGAGNAQRGGFTSSNGITDLLATGSPTSLSGFFVGGGGGGTVELPNPAGGNPIVVNSVNGLIRAISENTATNVLSTPQILALDNTEAEFEVGATVPIPNQVTNANGTTANNVQNQEAKLSLKITPQINKVTRFVKLKINQSVNEFQAAIPNVAGRPTTVRTAVTEVIVRDKDTIAMGGLLRNKETITHNKVPLLGDIPVLGWLFKNKRKDVEKVNLLMFMTPSIISPYETEASKVTGDAVSKAREAIKEEMIGDEKVPFHKQFDRIQEKIEKQKTEVLYDTKVENEFQRTNESDGIGGEL